jgi:5-formyltetrahydrofolate cyclo-ligase
MEHPPFHAPHLRRIMLEKRLAIPPAQRQWAANCIADKITQDEAFQQASHVALYMPSHGEIDIRPIIQRAWGEKKYCYLPIMQPDNHLAWAPYHQDTPLEPNAMGILEPPKHDTIAAKDLDLALVPLLAFNQQRHRLGYGKGCYDRSFALRASSSLLTPTLIGVAYAFQQVPTWQHQATDIPLDKIFTEKTDH